LSKEEINISIASKVFTVFNQIQNQIHDDSKYLIGSDSPQPILELFLFSTKN
jgi:hypothetical protein